jgi:Phenazine biosynthesis-like protein
MSSTFNLKMYQVSVHWPSFARNSLTMQQVDAFTSTPFSGNPAAVCLLDDSQKLSDITKLQIAAEMNLAETAFISVVLYYLLCIWLHLVSFVLTAFGLLPLAAR